MVSYPENLSPSRSSEQPQYISGDYDLWDDYGNDPDYADDDNSSVRQPESNQPLAAAVSMQRGFQDIRLASTRASDKLPSALAAELAVSKSIMTVSPDLGTNRPRDDFGKIEPHEYCPMPQGITEVNFSGSRDSLVGNQVTDSYHWPNSPHVPGLTTVSNQEYEQYSQTFDYSPTTPDHPHTVSQKKLEAQLATGMDFGLDSELVSPLVETHLGGDPQILQSPPLDHFNPISHGDINGDTSLRQRHAAANYGYNAYSASRCPQTNRLYSRGNQRHPYGRYYENGAGLPLSPQLSHGSSSGLLGSPSLPQSPTVSYGDGFGGYGNHQWPLPQQPQPMPTYPMPTSLGTPLLAQRSSAKKGKEEEKRATKRLHPPEFVAPKEQGQVGFYLMNLRKPGAWKRKKSTSPGKV